MKRLRNLFVLLALMLSHVLCIVVAYDYRGMQCGIAHQGFSAPAETAFLSAIPFGAGILFCAGLAYFFHRKRK